jgi:1-acyl-sn-glycerol-3-phosphate acyltransferase
MSKINPSEASDVRKTSEKLLATLSGPVLLAVALPWSLILGMLIVATPGLDRRRRLASWAARGFLRILGLRWQINGKRHVPSGGCVVVANHASYLDGIILTALLPPRFAFVIKKDMDRMPFAGLLLRRLDSLFVEHKSSNTREDNRRLLAHAAAGDALGMFPEGTFRPEPGLLPFRPGAFSTAARAGIPILPITIHGSRRALPARSLCPLPGPLTLDIHPPIWPEGRSRAQREHLQQEARSSIMSSLREPDIG